LEMNPIPLYQQTLEAMHTAPASEAYDLAQMLCAEQPGKYDPEQMAGIAALSGSRYELALKHFFSALRLTKNPTFLAATWCGIGRVYLDLRQSTKAETSFQRSLSLAPEFLPALTGLAEALNFLNRYQEAKSTAKHAIELGVSDGHVYTALAFACLRLKEFDAAETNYRLVLEQNSNSTTARYGLGLLARIHGRFDEAESYFRAISNEDSTAPGFEQLVGLKQFTDPADPDLTLMENLVADEQRTPPAIRAGLAFALAKAYDDLDDAERASHYLLQANHNDLENLFEDYDPQSDEQRMARISDLFTAEFIDRYAVEDSAELHPIFIVSLPRSGSTLTEQMIGTHSRIMPGGELGHFSKIATKLSLKWGSNPDFPHIAVDDAQHDIREAALIYARETARLRLIHSHFTDKSLENFLFIGMIRMMLPNARIVHIRRHPLATVLGIFRRRFGRGIRYSADLNHIARYYRAYARLMEHWRHTVPDAFMEIFYESLVTNPEYELHRIFDYLNLEYDPRVLEYYKLTRPVDTASVVQVRQPLQQTGIKRHERYRELLKPTSEILSSEISDYERDLSAHLAANKI